MNRISMIMELKDWNTGLSDWDIENLDDFNLQKLYEKMEFEKQALGLLPSMHGGIVDNLFGGF